MIRVALPYHLRNLAGISDTGQTEVSLPAGDYKTISDVLGALEAQYPALKGTMRDYTTHQRRAFVRFFACGVDMSLMPASSELPTDVLAGIEPFMVVGAIAGG